MGVEKRCLFRLVLNLIAAVLVVSALGSHVDADCLPPIQMPEAFPNLTFVEPIFLTAPADGSDRIFVVEKLGTIQVFPNDPTVTESTTFFSIDEGLSTSGGEQGLLGLACDPDYANNGYFYINYTASSSTCTDTSLRCTKVVRHRV
ncbi:MAG: PQQ-dependent sugar dehydrogenase, partial [Deltaproteobacteria bacterium]|nr:PQQ-dependent sugar dehydrogenase [Deltaproteobacteria bacterium]